MHWRPAGPSGSTGLRRAILVLFVAAMGMAGAADAQTDAEPSVLLITFAGVEESEPKHLGGEGWIATEALPGSNRPRRSLLGLLTGVPSALWEQVGVEASRDLLATFRVQRRGGQVKLWVASGVRDRVRLAGGLSPGLHRYRRLRAALVDLEGADPGFFWVDVAEPMGARASNIAGRLARALSPGPTLVVATTVDSDASGRVPVWIRTHGEGATELEFDSLRSSQSEQLTSLEAVGTAMQRFLGLVPPPLAVGSWPRRDIVVTETWREDDVVTLKARRAGGMVTVTWEPGALASCWERSASSTRCRWTRGRSRADRDHGSQDLEVEGLGESNFRALENRLLWLLERRFG